MQVRLWLTKDIAMNVGANYRPMRRKVFARNVL